MEHRFRVLFLYPSQFMQTGIPLSIACLAGALKQIGVEVKVFDTLRYRMEKALDHNLYIDGKKIIDQNQLRAELLHATDSIDYAANGVFPSNEDGLEILSRMIEEFKPDLIGMSSVESTFEAGIALTEHARKVTDVPIIAGGVFCTLAPEIAIKEHSLDIVCVGEGESALVELCERMRAGEDYSTVRGLWIKTDGKIVKNGPRVEDLAKLPSPDFSVLDPAQFLRPMRGYLFRTISIEFSRGCPYKCTFCAEPALERMFEHALNNDGIKSGFFRKQPMEMVIENIKRDVRNHNPEFFYFSSETFLAMTGKEFDQFIEGYEEISLPFWIQTRAETITYERIRRLKEVGLYWLAIGIEHGDEDFRRDVVGRPTKDEKIFEVFEALDRCDQGASANMIAGFPYETRELIFKSINFCRKLVEINPRSRFTTSMFTPYRGSALYDLAVKEGMWDPTIPYISDSNASIIPLLKSKFIDSEELEGIMRVFPLYVHLPEQYLSRVKLAEKKTPEGNRIFLELNEIVMQYLMRPAYPPQLIHRSGREMERVSAH